VELLIVATEVATGRPRYFRRDELTVDAVLASACLPTLHHPVEIDGRAYWDGGFSANPDLIRIAKESPVGDTLIVLLTPTVRSEPLGTVAEIAAETNRLTFNAPLLRDVEIIETVRECEGGFLGRRFGRPSRLSTLARHRYHLIEAGRHTSALSANSKMKPDMGMFTYLHGAGRTEAYKWLDGSHANIGRRSTVDLKARFLAPLPQFTLQLHRTTGDADAQPANDVTPLAITAARAGHSLR
jgi:NTE family protein